MTLVGISARIEHFFEVAIDTDCAELELTAEFGKIVKREKLVSEVRTSMDFRHSKTVRLSDTLFKMCLKSELTEAQISDI